MFCLPLAFRGKKITTFQEVTKVIMYTVTCESTCDLSYEYLQKRNCNVIFYSYFMDNEELSDSMQRYKHALFQLYENIATKKFTTSQLNEQQYEDFFREQLEHGDVLHLAFSSGLSQSINNARKAVENLQKENLPHKVVVVDTLCGGGGYGMLVDAVLDERDSGADFQTLCNWVEKNKYRLHSYLFSTDLTHFRRSGRVNGLTAFIGNLLGVCPVMCVNREGKIVAQYKSVSERRAIAKMADCMVEKAEGGAAYGKKLWIQHSNCFALATQTKFALLEKFKNVQSVHMCDVGIVMACHCGPGTVAIYFWGESERQ